MTWTKKPMKIYKEEKRRVKRHVYQSKKWGIWATKKDNELESDLCRNIKLFLKKTKKGKGGKCL